MDRCHPPDPPRAARGPSWARAGGRAEAPREASIGPDGSTASEAARTAAYLARNAVESPARGALEERLAAGRPLRVKLGLDPTAPDLHLGHTVVLQKLREFQDVGHTVVLIVGDYTARVGDPSGRSATRPVLSGEQIDANARTYVEQAGKILRTDERLELRHNSEWLDMRGGGSVPARARSDGGPAPRARRLRQALAPRASRSRCSSSCTRCSRATTRSRCESDIELGGTDQTFNLLMGRGDPDRVRAAGSRSCSRCRCCPGTDGVQKMSKSLGNHDRHHRAAG